MRKTKKCWDIKSSAKVKCLLKGAAAGAVICWLCYNSIYSLPVGIVICVACTRLLLKEEQIKEQQLFRYHFKDFIEALRTALMAGYSLENGLIAATKDTEMMHGSNDRLVIQLKEIIVKMQVKLKAEDLFYEMGQKSGIDDVRLFSALLLIGRKTGGNLNRLLADTANVICGKIQTKQEIETGLAEKKFEQLIMCLMPAGIIIYLRLSFFEMIGSLYGNIFGILVMTVALAVYVMAFVIGKRIVQIEV